MLRLLVLIGLIFLAYWLVRSMRAGIHEARTGGLPPVERPRPVGRHAWRIEEKQTREAVIIEVAHPTKGTRRRWELERKLPDFDGLLQQARLDAEALHGELAGSQP
jgi:hypothetical protein